jgi:two-component system, NtrC family, nitrogen regulation sensor histidine kinase NtrY
VRRKGSFLRHRTLERRLFAWFLVLSLVPALLLVGAGAWLVSGTLDLAGGLGPWEEVARTGRELVQRVEAGEMGPATQRAAERHRAVLSESLLLARRWAYLGQRLTDTLPYVALALSVLLTLVGLGASRSLARQIARPVAELVQWAERLSSDESLPEPGKGERRELKEIRALRDALGTAARSLRLARERALEAERIRIWGELARRVAHEMKNPLTPLRLAAHRMAASGDPTLQEPLTVIDEEVDRLEQLAQQFAALGRPPEGPTSPVDLGELLTSLTDSDLKPEIEREVVVEPGLPMVDAHYEALLRAFRNLLRNAADALAETEGPGRVRVRVARPDHADGDEGAPGVGRDAPGGWIEVIVADNGPGLPPGVEDRIFDPDFTTKSRGTGLGLALVRQAVEVHGGRVHAGNRPGGGAEFRVLLPVGDPERAADVSATREGGSHS